MERRVLLAVFLSFLVLYVYQALVAPPPAPPEERPRALDSSAGASPSVGPPTAGTTPAAGTVAMETTARETRLDASEPDRAPAPRSQITPIERPSPDPVVGDSEPREIIVEGDHFRAVFTNRGGELVSWQLKDYLLGGQPVELVPPDLPSEEPRSFSLAFEDENLSFLAHEALYRPSSNSVRVGERTVALNFEYEDVSGFRVRKVFAFDPTTSPYIVYVTVEASVAAQRLNPVIRWGPALGGDEEAASAFARREPTRGLLYGRVLADGVMQELGIERPSASAVVSQPAYDGQMTFLGVDNHYFLAAAIPGAQQATIMYRVVPLPPVVPDGDPRNLIAFDLALADGASNLPFFLGPKDFDILQQAEPFLVRAIDFGWLSFLVVPLHRSLKWIYGLVGNWGWAIILLTVVINILIFPLRHKSVVSMRKMQEVQPEMKAIQERYAHLKTTDPDKQKMNKEIMSLYRERGANPASGCLPMLATMPILFAFYRLLSMAIEIRGAPFLLWIADLSMHDPLYITPVFMGVSMVVTQRLTPSQADPTQQKIMMFMPIMFTFMFLWAPAGLVLYWLTSNVLGIGQQVITNRIIGPPKIKTVRPPAERLVKKGGGKAKGGKK